MIASFKVIIGGDSMAVEEENIGTPIEDPIIGEEWWKTDT
jgi:hypothetical protein